MRNATMLITVVFAVHLAPAGSLSPSAGRPTPPVNKTRMYYTVQVLAAPVENSDAFLRVYESLRTKGYLAHYCRAQVGERSYLRLRVGVFASRPEAVACAGQLRTTEGLDGFVTGADVAVDVFKDQFLVATTPSGIWLRGASARELYRFTPLKGEIEPRIARISPRGDAVAFYDENRIVTIALGTGAVKVLRQGTLEDGLWSSSVRWSPDGRFLAYLDDATWESPARLWVMRADGTENRCLVSDDSRQTKVKSFLWHPRQNRIFYILGPTYGTVSVGGSLWCTDLQGNRRRVVTAGVNETVEVYHQFHIAGNVLSYTLAHFDENVEVREYTSHTLALDTPD